MDKVISGLGIVACGSSKAWDKDPQLGEIEAQNVYTGSLFVKSKAYAENLCDRWVILSAKHGFLLPSDTVAQNYNVTFNKPSVDVITVSKLKKQVEQKQLYRFQKIVVLGGKKYVDIVSQVFSSGHVLEFPLEGCKGIGFMLQKLTSAIVDTTESSAT